MVSSLEMEIHLCIKIRFPEKKNLEKEKKMARRYA